MALIQADRVKELSTTTGSANFTLGGASLGFTSFSAGVGSSNTCYYAASDGSAFEVGLGTVSANVLERTTVFSSSHTSSGTIHRVDFQAGTKDVFATYVADKAVILDADGNLTVGTTANITTLGNVSVAKTLTITSGISGASTLNIKGAVSAGSTLGVKGNVSSEGTLSVIGAVSVGATLGITNDASVTGTFTFATANSTGNLGVVGNASVGGTFHIQGNTSAQGTLNVKGAVSVSSTLGVEGEINNEVGNIVIDPTTQIVEIKGGGSTDAELKLNCRSNSHGQTIKSQEHSAGVTNTMLLPKGANSTLVSEAGTATITNKTYFDLDGDLRDIPKSRTVATTTISAAQTDTGNFIFLTSADQTVVIPTASGTFDTGDIFSVVCAGASATISSNITSMFKVGEASATATITLGANKIASVLFVSAQHAYVTGT